jgi:tyrosyl-tRNA synthetase
LPLAGGATGMIGDPSGKSAERNLLTREQLAHNVECIKGQLGRLVDFEAKGNAAILVDNADWTAPLSFLDFLRDVGKHFPLSAMLAKDSVKLRMGSESGISYTEFSYQLLQAYDFYHLRKTYGCELQIGGSDQWGNITAGVDFVRRKLGETVWGWTFPLITKADGSKFGKTESGSVWLDPEKTSPYRFYQFFVNTEDAKVGEYLRKFTFLTRPEIEALEAAHAANPGAREAHKALAREVTAMVHGREAAEAAIAASQILFGGEIGDTPEHVFADVIAEIPQATLEAAALDGEGAALIDILVLSGLCPSKGQARRDLEGGGIYLNNQRSTGVEQRVRRADLVHGRHLLLRKGKKSYAAVTVAG